jgi:hypothetical protein
MKARRTAPADVPLDAAGPGGPADSAEQPLTEGVERSLPADAEEVCTWCGVLTGAVADFKQRVAKRTELTSEEYEAIHEVRRALAAIPRDL